MRYAIYFTPPAHDPLLRVAANWLGRNAFNGMVVRRPAPAGPGLADMNCEEISALTQEPRRYGFHATLKAPFRLHEDYEEHHLLSAMMHFASGYQPVYLPPLKIAQIGPFFALVPTEPCAALQQLANDVVVHFERFRAPLNEAELARRKPEKLDAVHRANLDQWGYPYVFEQFRFHMTLTGAVAEEKQAQVRNILEEFFAPVLNEPVKINNLALFTEAESGAAFEVHSLHPLTGRTVTENKAAFVQMSGKLSAEATG
ncbi:DUF1045 domain-containing protein [Pseudochrobactrum sp. HB0163]|uniref:DUF1045 domain-containing protein n=1 Tax=Pseudochrobactrum sp. HB0163 TaxID=3450708 RepID=UPI003F6DE97C